MEFNDKKGYWKRYGMIKGDYLFQIDELLDSHRSGQVPVDVLAKKLEELLINYRSDLGVCMDVARASLTPCSPLVNSVLQELN